MFNLSSDLSGAYRPMSLGFAPGEGNWVNRIPGANMAAIHRSQGLLANLGDGLQGFFAPSGPDAQPKRDAMLAAAASLLQGSGYSPQRRTFGQIVGNAMQTYQQTRRQSQADELERDQMKSLNDYRKAQIDNWANEGHRRASPFGQIDLTKFTSDSVRRFEQTNDYGDLVANPDATPDRQGLDSFLKASPADRALMLRWKHGDPHEAREPQPKPFTFHASDANSIRSATAGLFGGLFDPLSGSIRGLKPGTEQQVAAISERASDLFQDGGGSMTHDQAVATAAREAGINVPQVGASAVPPPVSPQTQPTTPARGSAPAEAIDLLRKNPQYKDQFKAKYGFLPPGI